MHRTTKHHSMAEILKITAGRDRDRGSEQVEEEIALAANASLQSTECRAELGPQPRRPGRS